MTVEKASTIINRKYKNVEQAWKPYGKRYFCAIINGRPSNFTITDLKKCSGGKD